MIPYERQEKIVEIVSEIELIRIEELQEMMSEVSISTLRRDLKELEGLGKIQFLSGGAVKIANPVLETPLITKSTLNTKEKKYIAQLAKRYVSDGDTVYIDSGSTCSVLLKELLNKDIHIVTSNMDVLTLTGEFKAEITVLGGSYDPKISSLRGPLTEMNIKNFVFNKSFLGANGVDSHHGITTHNLIESTKKKLVLENSKKAFLLCDSSKFGEISAVKIFDLNEVNIISNKSDDELGSIIDIITE